MSQLRIGTRASDLAVAQAQMVAARLQKMGFDTILVQMQTRGDRILDRALDKIGGKGLFSTELENALMHGDVDLAVHSLKDLPTELPPGLMVGALTLPADSRDALLAREGWTFEQLPKGSRIGTSSLRRTAFIKALRPDIEVVPVRGTLETRVRKWRNNGWEGLILAAAGVHRLGWDELITEYMDPWQMVPSPGQGVLAVEVRKVDGATQGIVSQINDQHTASLVKAERAVLATLEGGCQIPLGAYAEWVGTSTMRLKAKVATPDGRQSLEEVMDGPGSEAERIGRQVGERLILRGAKEMITGFEKKE